MSPFPLLLSHALPTTQPPTPAPRVHPPHCPCPWVFYSWSLTCPFPFFPQLPPFPFPSGHCQFVLYFYVSHPRTFCHYFQRERKGEKLRCKTKALIGCFLHTPNQGSCVPKLGIEPSYRPWPGIGLTIFGYRMTLQPTSPHWRPIHIIFSCIFFNT